MDQHHYQVEEIAAAVQRYSELCVPFRVFHGSSNSTRPRHGRTENIIDISSLCHVLSIDVERRVALVEPNVPMDRLVEATSVHGLVPPVVMEFPGITVGGGFSGTSGESSSFRHGFFSDTVNFVEMVLGNGNIVTASREKHEELFHGAAGAAGTLGIVTVMELRLVEARRFVKTTFANSKAQRTRSGEFKSIPKTPALTTLTASFFPRLIASLSPASWSMRDPRRAKFKHSVMQVIRGSTCMFNTLRKVSSILPQLWNTFRCMNIFFAMTELGFGLGAKAIPTSKSSHLTNSSVGFSMITLIPEHYTMRFMPVVFHLNLSFKI